MGSGHLVSVRRVAVRNSNGFGGIESGSLARDPRLASFALVAASHVQQLGERVGRVGFDPPPLLL
jgi:hypothetical protein